MKTGRLVQVLAACAVAALVGCRTIPPPVFMVNASAKTPESQRLADSVAVDLREKLARRGYPVVLAEPENTYTPVVDIDILFNRRETATLDVWRSYEGSASAKVSTVGGVFPRYHEEEIPVCERAFKSAGGRADNEIDAEEPVRQDLAAQLDAWLSEVLPAPVEDK